MGLLYLNTAEIATAFEIEGLEAFGLLGVAVALHTSKGGIDVVLDTDVLVDTNLNTAEATVERDNGTVHDVGITQVEADETEAGMYLGTFKTLAVIAVFVLAETRL